MELVRSEALDMREVELFNAVVRWGKSGKKQSKAALKAKLAPLMAHVRFGIMQPQELADTVMPFELVDTAVTADALGGQFA